MKEVGKNKRRAMKPVHCHICGSWVCDLEMENGRVIQKCPKCDNRIVVTVHGNTPMLYKDRRVKTA